MFSYSKRDNTLNLSLQRPPPPLVCLTSFCVSVFVRVIIVFLFFILSSVSSRLALFLPFNLSFSSLCLVFSSSSFSWSEVVFRDVACHSSAWPIKHTVMTDWPRSKLITDWLTERGALFCSAVFDSCLPDI